jgi:glycosyltransferase involved in cell wall biosynthesis
MSSSNKHRVRIMHVITSLSTGGAEMMLLKLLSASKGDWDHAVVSLADEGTIGPRISALGIPVYSLGLRRSVADPFRALSIARFTRQFSPHLIQGWMYHGNLIASLAGVCSKKHVPVIWNVQMSLYDVSTEPWLTATVIRLGARFSRRAAAIVYNSQLSAKQHEVFGYRAEKQIVIPTGFDCETFRPDENARRQVRAELGIADDAIVVGLIARFHPMKNHAGFLQAAGQVARMYPQVRFVLAGRGATPDEPSLQKMVQEQSLQSRIFLLGERSDIPTLTASLDIACSSSAWGEGCSNSIGEAMACGVPCVVTNVGDSAHIVGDTGIAVPRCDPSRLAQASSELIEAGADRRRHLGTAARQRIETDFSLSTVARRYGDLYLSCL